MELQVSSLKPCPFCGRAPEVGTDAVSGAPEHLDERTAQSLGLGSAGWINVPTKHASCRYCGVMRVPLSVWDQRVPG